MTYACTPAGPGGPTPLPHGDPARGPAERWTGWDADDRTELAALLERMVADFRRSPAALMVRRRPAPDPAVSALAGRSR